MAGMTMEDVRLYEERMNKETNKNWTATEEK